MEAEGLPEDSFNVEGHFSQNSRYGKSKLL